MPKNMTEDQREAFLADLHVGVLGVERADGPPLVVPVWYWYEPGGDVEVLTSGESLKGRLLARTGRATLCAQEEDLPYEYVSVEGPVRIDHLDEQYGPEVERMAIRYLGDELGRQYAAQEATGNIRVSLTPERWFTYDYS